MELDSVLLEPLKRKRRSTLVEWRFFVRGLLEVFLKTKDSGTDYFACDFRDVLTGGTSEDTPAESPAPEPQSIGLSAVCSSDGIISTLDDDFSDAAVQYEGAKRPFRCMFVKDQKLKSGQRVTLRLLEDYNTDGIRIPANTHLAAICKIGDRLELQVRSLDALASTQQVKS